jgi:hypothetical protein
VTAKTPFVEDSSTCSGPYGLPGDSIGGEGARGGRS